MNSELKNGQGVLPLSCLPASYRHIRLEGKRERTHFWVSIPDPEFVFDLIKLDAQDPPEDLWGIALLKIVKLEKGKVQVQDEMLELVFEMPFRPEMVELVDLWLVRLKSAVKEAMNNRT